MTTQNAEQPVPAVPATPMSETRRPVGLLLMTVGVLGLAFRICLPRMTAGMETEGTVWEMVGNESRMWLVLILSIVAIILGGWLRGLMRPVGRLSLRLKETPMKSDIQTQNTMVQQSPTGGLSLQLVVLLAGLVVAGYVGYAGWQGCDLLSDTPVYQSLAPISRVIVCYMAASLVLRSLPRA